MTNIGCKELNKEHGKRLRECLIDAGMTQKELAEKANYTPQFISNVIKGKRNMSLQSAEIFAEILHVQAGYLLGTDVIKTSDSLAANRVSARVARNCALQNVLSSFNVHIYEAIVDIKTPEGKHITDHINPPEHFISPHFIIGEKVEQIYNSIFSWLDPHEDYEDYEKMDIPKDSIILNFQLKINTADHEHEHENYKIVPYDIVFDMIVDILDFIDYKCDRLKETMNAEHFRRHRNY